MTKTLKQDNTRVVLPQVRNLNLNVINDWNKREFKPAVNTSDNTRVSKPIVDEIDFNNPVSVEERLLANSPGYADSKSYSFNAPDPKKVKEEDTKKVVHNTAPQLTTWDKVRNVGHDFNTFVSNTASSLGSNIPGDILAGVYHKPVSWMGSREPAQWLSDKTQGVLPYTTEQQYKDNRYDPGREAWRKHPLNSNPEESVAARNIGTAANGVRGALIGIMGGKAMQTTAAPIAGALNRRAFRRLPERILTAGELSEANYILGTKGILPGQKNLNPLKNIVNKVVEPYGYKIAKTPDIGGIPSRKEDIIGYLLDKKNPYYSPKASVHQPIEYYNYADNRIISAVQSPTYRELINKRVEYRSNPKISASSKNRFSTWDMYLGKDQLKNPMYEVSPLSTNKNTVYTVKPEYTSQPSIERVLKHKLTKERTSAISQVLPARDTGYFGTMGGHNWKVTDMPNGNTEVLARDVWDLNPFQDFGRDAVGNRFRDKVVRKIAPSVRKIEVGKALGIGKPLNVQVGFELNPQGQIIRQFDLGGILKKYKI